MSAANLSPEQQIAIAKKLDKRLDELQREYGFRDEERICYYLAAAYGEARRSGLGTIDRVVHFAANFLGQLDAARTKRLRPRPPLRVL